MIHHLSYPKGSSVNDGISPGHTSVSYAAIADAIRHIKAAGRGCYLAKTDVKTFFRIILIRPLDYRLLGMRWRNLYYYDRCMPMGCSSSCKTFETLSTTMEWIAQNKLRINHIIHLLVRAFVLCFWIPSVAFTVIMLRKFDILKMYGYALNSFMPFGLSLLLSCCYSKIVFALRHHQAAIQDQVHQEQPNGEIAQNMQQYGKTVSTAMCILLALIVCYLPYSVVLAIVTTNGSSPFLHAIWAFITTLVCLNSTLNPLLYCWRIKEVRHEAENTIRHMLCFTN